jgi:hypothetical protein
MDPVRLIQFTNELRFAQPREHVFEAFLDTEKWFQISYGEERLKGIVNERRVGGDIYEDWGGGSGKLYGTIGWWDPPTGYSQTSHMLGGGITLTHRYEFIEDGDGTLLSHQFTAFGPMSDDMVEGIEYHASLATFERQLRSWIDEGEVTPLAPAATET